MKPLFVDTGAFYAKYVASDVFHAKAIASWAKVVDEKWKCVTTHFVLSEFITLLAYRFGSKNAVLAAREIYASRAIEIVPIDLKIELDALEWMEKFADQKFSMTDATSFAFMKANKIKTAFTFDIHFEIAGFIKLV